MTTCVGTRRSNKVDGVFNDIIWHRHATDSLLEGNYLLGRKQLLRVNRMVGRSLANNIHLFFERRVVEADIEHKTVELSFRQRIGAFLLDGVLCCEDKERVRQRIGSTCNGDGMLLHSFEKGGLSLGWCTVDFVSEDNTGKDWTFHEAELPVLVKNFATGDIGWHKVGSELYAVEREAHCLSQSIDHKGLCQTGYSKKQTMTTSENRQQKAVDCLMLANNNFGYLAAECVIFLYQKIELFFVRHSLVHYELLEIVENTVFEVIT